MKRHFITLKHVQRLLILLFFLCICLIALLSHLIYIQVIAKENYQGVNLVSKSIEQRARNVILDIGRGDILARDQRSLTGVETLSIMLLPKRQEMIAIEKKELQQLANILGVNETILIREIASINYPQLLHINRKQISITEQQKALINDLHISGLLVIESKNRYPENMIAKHVIGFIGEDQDLFQVKYRDYLQMGIFKPTAYIGKAGLEYTYELDLRSEGAKILSYYIYQDRNQDLQPFYGLGMTMQESKVQHRPTNIITTIDYDMQEYSESLLDRYKVQKGSVVILDISNGDILTMASRPNYNPEEIKMEEFNHTRNRAISATFPGSVFKTVIAAGILEEGLATIHDRYDCSGSLPFSNGQSLKCWKVHGNLSLFEAFASSCNVTFANLAIQLGRDNIEKYAWALGLGDVVGYFDNAINQPQLYREEKGSIFRIDGGNQQLLANTGIGQQDVQVTALQAANMMAGIANMGKQYQPRLVTELQSKRGHSIRKYPVQNMDSSGISRHTYYQLQKMLQAVTEIGTASMLIEEGVSAAGKTGTAELGKSGQVNRWFTGYFPAHYPKYAITVVVEDVPSYRHIGDPTNIFKDIVKRLP